MPFAAPRMKVGKGLSAAFRRTTLGWRRGPGSDHTASTPWACGSARSANCGPQRTFMPAAMN